MTMLLAISRGFRAQLPSRARVAVRGLQQVSRRVMSTNNTPPPESYSRGMQYAHWAVGGGVRTRLNSY